MVKANLFMAFVCTAVAVLDFCVGNYFLGTSVAMCAVWNLVIFLVCRGDE